LYTDLQAQLLVGLNNNASDITALVLVFHEDNMFQLLPFFWIPEEKMLEKIKKENINYDLWGNGYVRIYRDHLFRPVRLHNAHTPLLLEG